MCAICVKLGNLTGRTDLHNVLDMGTHGICIQDIPLMQSCDSFNPDPMLHHCRALVCAQATWTKVQVHVQALSLRVGTGKGL